MRSIDLVQDVEQAEPDARQVGWFAARQPGIVSFLEARCGICDGLAVALDAAWRLCCAIERRDGVPPRRVPRTALERADELLGREAQPSRAGSCADRQPELVAWVAELVAKPPLPLSIAEQQAVGTALLAVVCALDHVATGRRLE